VYAEGTDPLSEQDEASLRRLAETRRPQLHQDPLRPGVDTRPIWFIYYHTGGLGNRAHVFFRPDSSGDRIRKGVVFELWYSPGDLKEPSPFAPEDYVQVAPKDAPFSSRVETPDASVLFGLPALVQAGMDDLDVVSIVDQIRAHAPDLNKDDVGDSLIDIPSHWSKPGGFKIEIQFNYESTFGAEMLFEGGPGHYRYSFVGPWVL
jgi:hypothetical protein